MASVIKLDKSEFLTYPPITVLIVEDHALMRSGLRALLSTYKDIKIVGEASNGEQAITMVRELSPDIVLMDLNMPGIGGLEATQRILRTKVKTGIIALTEYTDEPFPSRFMKVGGAGYLTKNTTGTEIINAIRLVKRGEFYITPEIAQKMALNQVTGATQTPFANLSERELQVMWMLTQGEKVNQIAAKLCLSPKTINTYRYRLFEKLTVTNDVDLTHLALRYGIIDQNGIVTN